MNGEIRTGIKLTGDSSGLTTALGRSEVAAGEATDSLADLGKALDDYIAKTKAVGKTVGENMDKAAAATKNVGAGMKDSAAAAKGYTEATEKATRAAKAQTDEVGRQGDALSQMGKRLREVISIAAAWQVGKLAIATADEMTVLSSRLKLVTTNSTELAYVQGRLFAIAQQSRVDFAELGATYAQIARASADLGVSQERMLGVVESIGQAMAISGGEAQSMKAALIQLSQGLASGTLRGEELNSVMEQTPRLAQAIAQGMGVSLGQLRALGQDGKLTALSVIEALERAAPALRREFEQVTPTISQSFTTLKNSSAQFIAELDRATGASRALSGQMSGLASTIASVGQAVAQHEREWNILLGAAAGAAGVGALAFAYGRVAAGVSAVGAALAANPTVALLLGAGAAVGAASSAQDSFNKTEASAQQRLDRLTDRLARLDAEIQRGGNAADVRRAIAERARVQKHVERAQVDVGSFQEATNAARDSFRASERSADARQAAAVPFPGAKPLEEVRKYAKLAVDVQREAYDQSVDIAKSFENRIALATSAEERIALVKERDAKLISLDKEAKREMQSIAERGASEAKTLAEAMFSQAKATQEKLAAVERRAIDERSRTNEQFYKLGLMDVDEYYKRRAALEVEAIEISERLTQSELAQARAVKDKAQKQADVAQAQARVLSLERDLYDLGTRKAAAQAVPGNERALRLRAEEQAARDAAINDRIRSRDMGYDLAREMEDEVRRMGVDAIRDPYARSRAQLTEELRQRKKVIDEILDPDARALAEQRFNDLVVAKNAELAERLKPGWQTMLDAWQDTSREMRDTYNRTMEGMLADGENAFVQSGGRLVDTARSVAQQIGNELLRLVYRRYLAESVSSVGGAILDAVVGAFGGSPDTSQLPTGDFSRMDRLQTRASGGSYQRGLVLRGEKGPELSWENTGGYVFNAQQTRDILAGAGNGGSTPGVQVVLNVVNQSGASVQKTGERQRADGGVEIDLLIGAVTDAMADQVASGTGPLASAMERRYGLRTEVA